MYRVAKKQIYVNHLFLSKIRAVGRSENPWGGWARVNPRPFKEEGFADISVKIKGGKLQSPLVPTAMRHVRLSYLLRRRVKSLTASALVHKKTQMAPEFLKYFDRKRNIRNLIATS